VLAALVLIALLGYLLGSLPFGYVVARAKGVNIFEVGSKTPAPPTCAGCLGPVRAISFSSSMR